jgi:histidinol-phosphate aminotransferase
MQRSVLTYIEGYDPGIFPQDAEERYGIAGGEVTNLASNENPYPPPASVLEAIESSIGQVNRYPDPGYRELKGELSGYTGLPPENIAVGNGSTEILDMVCKVFIDPFDRISIMSPSYTMYALMGMIRESTIEFVETRENGYRINVDFLMKRARDSKMIFLCSPNNPTGMVLGEGQLEEILGKAGGMVLLDEAYAEFAGTSAINLVADHQNLVVTRSMSKFFSLAGLRVGYCIAGSDIVESLEKVRQPFSISTIGEAAATAALREVPYYEKNGKRLLSERERLLEKISEMPGLDPYPSRANFLMVRVDPGLGDIVESLMSMGVLVRDLSGLSGLEGPHIRITVGTPGENKILLSSLKDAIS